MVLVSGTLGDHGIAVLGARGELGFETDVQSDVAPLNGLIRAVLAAAPTRPRAARPNPRRAGDHAERDRRAEQASASWLDEKAIPVQPAVQAACEMLGFDPLYVANEGKVIVIVPEAEAAAALAAMRAHPYGAERRAHRRGPGRAAQARADAHADRRHAHPGCAGRRNAAPDLLSLFLVYLSGLNHNTLWK